MRGRNLRFSKKSPQDSEAVARKQAEAELSRDWISLHSCPQTGAKNRFAFSIAKAKEDVSHVPVMAELIKGEELKNRMKKIPEWELEKKHIERTFEFDEFSESIDFVNSVAEVAEDEEHHPDIDIRFNKVRLVLSTHSKGGVTELDFDLAERIDTLRE